MRSVFFLITLTVFCLRCSQTEDLDQPVADFELINAFERPGIAVKIINRSANSTAYDVVSDDENVKIIKDGNIAQFISTVPGTYNVECFAFNSEGKHSMIIKTITIGKVKLSSVRLEEMASFLFLPEENGESDEDTRDIFWTIGDRDLDTPFYMSSVFHNIKASDLPVSWEVTDKEVFIDYPSLQFTVLTVLDRDDLLDEFIDGTMRSGYSGAIDENLILSLQNPFSANTGRIIALKDGFTKIVLEYELVLP